MFFSCSLSLVKNKEKKKIRTKIKTGNNKAKKAMEVKIMNKNQEDKRTTKRIHTYTKTKSIPEHGACWGIKLIYPGALMAQKWFSFPSRCQYKNGFTDSGGTLCPPLPFFLLGFLSAMSPYWSCAFSVWVRVIISTFVCGWHHSLESPTIFPLLFIDLWALRAEVRWRHLV